MAGCFCVDCFYGGYCVVGGLDLKYRQVALVTEEEVVRVGCTG